VVGNVDLMELEPVLQAIITSPCDPFIADFAYEAIDRPY
jgi:hypothetical protein